MLEIGIRNSHPLLDRQGLVGSAAGVAVQLSVIRWRGRGKIDARIFALSEAHSWAFMLSGQKGVHLADKLS